MHTFKATLQPVNCTPYSAGTTLHITHCTLTLYIVQCTLDTEHFTLITADFTLPLCLHFKLHTAHCTLHTAQLTAVQYTVGAVWLQEIKGRADPSMSRVLYRYVE